MRMLSKHELDLIAGGVTSSGYYGEEGISVTGYRLRYEDNMWNRDPYSGGGTPYDSGSGGQGGPEEAPVEEPNDTPCVETTLANGVSTTDVNRAALAASKAIALLNDEILEYSSIIWALNGEVGFTDPYTTGENGSINFLGGIAGVPSGATIVGIIHNHPDEDVVDDTIPSGVGSNPAPGTDWFAYNSMVGDTLQRGITVDSNMLLYIFTNEDGSTHVYDNTDKNQAESTNCSKL